MVSERAVHKLAIDGGEAAISEPLPPMFPGGMRIGTEEEEAVLEVLRSRRLFRYYGPTPGPSKTEGLETRFAEMVGTRHAIAVTSCSSALFCALMGIGVGPGDEVIVPAFTWIASANAVIAAGAVPIIADVDESLTLDPSDAERKITPATKAIIAVHMRGAPCNMDALSDIAQRHGLKLIEDVAQACGGSYKGKRLGSIGDVGAFSFQFNKILTAGEGGMVVTNDDVVHERALQCQDVAASSRHNLPAERVLPGTNHRMSEMHAAVMGVQMNRLDGLLADMRDRKSRIKEGIGESVREHGLAFRALNDADGDTAIALIIYFPTIAVAHRARQALAGEGVRSSVLYDADRPDLHIAPFWDAILNKQTWTPEGGPWRWHESEVSYDPSDWAQSLDLLGRAINIDISPELTDRQVDEVIEAIQKTIAGVMAGDGVA